MIDFIGLGYFFLTLIASIFFHEVGHITILQRYNDDKDIVVKRKGLKWIVGKEEHYNHLNKKQLFDVYISGIILGTIPIFFFMLELNPPKLFVIGLFLIYFSGCRNDFKKMRRFVFKSK